MAKGIPLMGRGPDGKAKIINVDENGNVKVQQSGTFVEVIQLVSGYDGVENQHDFVRVPPPRGDGNAILLPEREEYRDYDIVVRNTYDVEFRFAVEPIGGATPTILLCNGDLAPFSTSISEDSAQITVPAGVNHLYLSQLPIKRVGDGMEAADPQIWRKFGDKVRLSLRARDTPSNGGYISVWFVGYK